MTEVTSIGLNGLVGSRLPELVKDISFVDFSRRNGLDLSDPDSIRRTIPKGRSDKPVLLMAAFTDTNAAFQQSGDKDGSCWRTNVTGTEIIADLCRRANQPLVYVSTDYVYDGLSDVEITEDMPVSPTDWYGITKAEAEKIVLSLSPDNTVVRIAGPYRAYYPEKLDFIRKSIKHLHTIGENQPLKLFHDRIIVPTLIDDIAIGLGIILRSRAPGIYHLVGSEPDSPYNIHLALSDIFSLRNDLFVPTSVIEYNQLPNVRTYPPKLPLSNRKFVNDFGFRPKGIEDGFLELKRQIQARI